MEYIRCDQSNFYEN